MANVFYRQGQAETANSLYEKVSDKAAMTVDHGMGRYQYRYIDRHNVKL